jgi:beta-lactamase regulating signal transducer with metallopeptidase domain
MNRFILLSVVALPMLLDASLKSAVLLMVAGVCALAMHRASAAARHVVWVAAVVALLLVPVLSVVLPRWHVLPQWAVVETQERTQETKGTEMTARTVPVAAVPILEMPTAPTEPVPALPSLPPFKSLPSFGSFPPAPPQPDPTNWVLPLWAAGCALLLLRLSASHFLLRRATSRCEAAPASLSQAFAAAASESELRQPVQLLVDHRRTIPVVWGIFRPCLLLPAESLDWDAEQLRSVLLHEIAHLRRRDPLVQCLMQLACALHWFNPLVWLAAWRLHVEREKACDDLVLARGVKPSAYAEHLLQIASQLTPVRWTAGCGLAMARKSSLEGRLMAVLSDRLNRTSTTRMLAAAAVFLAAAIAVPLAMLRAAEPEKAKPAETPPAVNADPKAPSTAATPIHKDARSLYEFWQSHARANGHIPGALIGQLAAGVKQFIRYNPTWETVPKLNEILPKLDATHDWKPADAIALLDEVAAVKDSPLSMASMLTTRHTIRQGEPLPKKFTDAPWGEAEPTGLRAAWVLEPDKAEHRFGDALRARLLVHNSGKVNVTLQVPTWHQGSITATDAKGAELEVSSVEWTTIATSVPVRLAPGEFIEINTPGVGFGPRAGMGPWAGPRVGSNVLKDVGADLTLTHSLVPLDGSEVGMSEDDPHVVGPGWWLAHIKARLSQELPLPADAAERTRLLDRTVRDLFATDPSDEETATFVADKTPDAFDSLVKRLAAREDVVSFSGKLPTVPVKFRVLAALPSVDEKARVVLGPGEYPIGGASTLKIVSRQVGDRHTNDAQIVFAALLETGQHAPNPHKLEVPDGWGTWAIVCRPSDGFLYLLHKGIVRKIDHSDPAKVTDTPANDLPAEFSDEVKRILDIY